MQEELSKKTDYELLEIAQSQTASDIEDLAKDELVKRYRHLVYEIVDHSFTSEEQTEVTKATLIQRGFNRLRREMVFYRKSDESFYMYLAKEISKEIQDSVKNATTSKKEETKDNSSAHLKCLYDIVDMIYEEGGPSKVELLNEGIKNLSWHINKEYSEIYAAEMTIRWLKCYIDNFNSKEEESKK